MSVALVWLAALMGAATYPWRAIPLLAPGIDRLAPVIREYLRLVGPAMLATLAAVSLAVVVDANQGRILYVGPEWLAVAACVAIVVARRGLLLGLLVAAGLIALLRAIGWA